jgi:hypothetical protein
VPLKPTFAIISFSRADALIALRSPKSISNHFALSSARASSDSVINVPPPTISTLGRLPLVGGGWSFVRNCGNGTKARSYPPAAAPTMYG